MARTDVQQVAALPYRIEADGLLRVMLITSRETRRWVVPKGHPMTGFAAHEAAAQEAWEEAGLRGFPCAAPIGIYTYVKRRRVRGDASVTVAVYPLCVADQAEDWPERHQRVTQWFDLEAAAARVDEPGLKALIAGFRVPPASTLASRVLPVVRTGLRRRVPMLGWFQSLLPRQGRFFELFEAHTGTLVAGADALARLFHGEGDAKTQIDEIVAREHEADDITRDVLQDVRRVFVTPFDRSAITGLIGVMDDAIDQMNSTATAIQLYEVTQFAPRMRDMAGIVVEAARVTAEAIPLLRSLVPNAGRLNELTARIIEIEGHADAITEAGIKELYKTAQDPMRFIVGREIYGSLEKIVDRFEDVANEIQGLVIDHA
ncbi:DUF47 family protein [Sphingomonas bacterium]|uniref:DUF47 family protein n=1 Tax=Sphingomonas bacterium TaxID=1895847 RepID=UPI0020C5FE99|nr:DUF47 family protein [Sphingomonas bacterium]